MEAKTLDRLRKPTLLAVSSIHVHHFTSLWSNMAGQSILVLKPQLSAGTRTSLVQSLWISVKEGRYCRYAAKWSRALNLHTCASTATLQIASRLAIGSHECSVASTYGRSTIYRVVIQVHFVDLHSFSERGATHNASTPRQLFKYRETIQFMHFYLIPNLDIKL